MKPIFLIGFMGSGKTTLGRALEETTSMRFIDLDDYIEERIGMSISEYFTHAGEDGFRRAERDALREIADGEDVVIACGGGTPCFFDNMEVMNSRGTTVWLDASRERLFERLIVAIDHRPLLKTKSPDQIREFIDSSLKERHPYYSQAHFMLPSDLLENPREIASTVTQFLQLVGLHHLM